MKNRFSTIVCLAVFALYSCNSNITIEDVNKLNGYWEIKEVEFSNGESKDYKVNETIDFFEVKNNKGFRQKVMPQFDGRFKTNGIRENIKIVTGKEGEFYIEYKTPYGSWREQIMEIEDSSLVLKNKENIEYTYKRFKPFTLK